MSSRLHPLEEQVRLGWPPERWQDVRVVIAVSGGADSVALTRALCALQRARSRLIVAHYDHGWRGAASEEDAQFVEQLAEKLQLGCEIRRATNEEKARSEETARQARYRFLHETAERVGARYVVTAHTLDDQAETILHRIVRGTGLSGLAGIPRARALTSHIGLARPLLQIRRAEVLTYLADLEQPFRVDVTNEDRRYTRNRLRHELLPLLAEAYNPQIVASLLRLGQQAAELDEILQPLVDPLQQASVSHSNTGSVEFACEPLADAPRLLVRELVKRVWRQQHWPLQAMGFDEWERLAAMLQTRTDEVFTLPGNVRAERRGRKLLLSREAGEGTGGSDDGGRG